MITKLANRWACFFVAQDIIKESDARSYAYGMELLISTVINLALIFIISILSGKLVEIFFFVTPFFFIRQLIGGYHLKTHLGCILLMAAVVISYVYLVEMFHSSGLRYDAAAIIMYGMSFVSIYFFAPSAHPNKPLDNQEKQSLRYRALVAMLFVLGIFIYLIMLKKAALCFYISVGIFTASLAMVAGKAAYKPI